MADQLGTGHFRHDDVADDQVEHLPFELLDCFGAAAASDGIIIEVFQRTDGRGADSRIVFYQQDAGARHMGVGIGLADGRVNAHRCGDLRPRQVDRNARALADGVSIPTSPSDW